MPSSLRRVSLVVSLVAATGCGGSGATEADGTGAPMVLAGHSGSSSTGKGGATGAGAMGNGGSAAKAGNGNGGTGAKSGNTGVGAGGSAASGGGVLPTGCDPSDSFCKSQGVGPSGTPVGTFPLPGDAPNVGGDGIVKDPNGWLVLGATQNQLDFLWIADDLNYGMGLVSKVQTKAFPTKPTYREVARYATFTCLSTPGGSNEGLVLGKETPKPLCVDGKTGCCSVSESTPGPNGGHQGINVWQNRPSRTAIDFNGDAWVANRAHEPEHRQSSTTKIANSTADCIDRNKNGKIDTSSDVNGDGIITTDCDDDNLPDTGSTVCKAGKAHEFYGLDDECILFTTNTGVTGNYGRPLTLGPGTMSLNPDGNNTYGPSDAWPGTWKDGTFYRLDGKTGAIKTTVKIKDEMGVAPMPYGAAIDRYGILWAPNEGSHNLFWFDTNMPTQQGMVIAPPGGVGFYGIAIDGYTVQMNGKDVQLPQVWLGEVGGSGAFRYRPLRDGTYDGLNKGTWAYISFSGGKTQGRGIGVDNRKPVSFAWVALDGGAMGRIPTNVPDGPTVLPGAMHTFDTGAEGTLGAGVALDLDIWGINQGSSSATHFKVDPMGNIVGPPDQIPLDDKPTASEAFCPSALGCKPHPYTYSDFTGFGLKNFTNPHGSYTWIQGPCAGNKAPKWLKVLWDANVPMGTTLGMRARTADTLAALATAPWVGTWKSSPADLSAAPGPVAPNPGAYLQVEFDLSTQDPQVSPALKGFQIAYDCLMSGPG